MTYAHKQALNTQFEPPFTLVPHLNISAHHCLQALDIIFNNVSWQLINFYHDIQDNSSLKALLDLDIDALMPTLIIGNFNTHSLSWSPPDATHSSWARKVEEWAAKNLLTLSNTPGEVTHKGADHELDLVIDLAWYNEVVVQANMFTNLKIDWEGSLSSDHVLLQVSAFPGPTCHPPPSDANLGFMIDPDLKGD